MYSLTQQHVVQQPLLLELSGESTGNLEIELFFIPCDARDQTGGVAAGSNAMFSPLRTPFIALYASCKQGMSGIFRFHKLAY